MLGASPPRWLTLVALLSGAIGASALMMFDGGFWRKKLISHVPWALMPYAFLLALYLGSRWFRIHPSVQRALHWGIILVALAGPLLYIDTLFVHVDAQGALAMLMVPVMQAGGALFLIFTALLWSWRINNIAAKPAQQTGGKMVLRKLTKFVLVTATIGAALLYTAVSILQYMDRTTIDTAKEVDFYITQYCRTHYGLPTSARLRERFPGLSTATGWYYFTDDKTWLKLQYPVRWRNKDAIGERRISEFTATVYAYSVEYHCKKGN